MKTRTYTIAFTTEDGGSYAPIDAASEIEALRWFRQRFGARARIVYIATI